MNRRAVILFPGNKYNICCDVDYVDEFLQYLMTDERHMNEIKQIINCLREGVIHKKAGREGDAYALKPFMNTKNDRIICNITKRKNKTQCIVMAELFPSKKTMKNDKKIKTRYQIVSNYRYEIIE